MNNELQDHWNKINQQRAAFYGWFAGVFAHELSKQAFTFYSDGSLKPLLEVFEQIGFESEVKPLEAFIDALEGTEDERVELMADFAASFLLSDRNSALPYASYYLEEDKLLYGDANTRMAEFLAGNQLELHEDFREPADHLAVYLAVMSDWCAEVADETDPVVIQQQIEQQHEFLTDGLLSWLGAWAERLSGIPSLSYDFYPAMGRLLLSYVQADAAAMGDDDDSPEEEAAPVTLH